MSPLPPPGLPQLLIGLSPQSQHHLQHVGKYRGRGVDWVPEIGCKDCGKQRFKQLRVVNSERRHHCTCVFACSRFVEAVSDNVLEKLAGTEARVNFQGEVKR